MPGDWAQRVRQLGENVGGRDAVDQIRSRAAAANPFTSSPPAQQSPPGGPPGSGFDPFTAPPASPVTRSNPFTGAPTYPPSVDTGEFAAPPGETGSVPARPLAVKVAAWALIAAAILTLTIGGMGAYAISELRTTVGHVLDLDQTGTATLLASGYADDTQVVLMVISVAVAAVMAVAYLLVCRAIWRGRSWPRTVSPFLAVLSIPAIFIGPVAIGIVAAGAVSTVAAWMPSARAYAQQQAAVRAAARAQR